MAPRSSVTRRRLRRIDRAFVAAHPLRRLPPFFRGHGAWRIKIHAARIVQRDEPESAARRCKGGLGSRCNRERRDALHIGFVVRSLTPARGSQGTRGPRACAAVYQHFHRPIGIVTPPGETNMYDLQLSRTSAL